MAFNVRIFGHRGVKPMNVTNRTQFGSDSVYQLVQPYEWSQVISVSAAPARSAPIADAPGINTTIIRVEVADAQNVRYEICPPGRAVDAGNASPILSGHDQFAFASGWTISLVDAASFP